MALFTAGLWIFTALLWNITRIAVRDTADSIKHTKAMAEAASRQADIAERALVATSRPWLVIHPLDEITPPEFCAYELVNYGSSPAIIVEMFADIICVEEPISEADIVTQFLAMIPNNVIAPGERRRQQASMDLDVIRKMTDPGRAYVVGRIIYSSIGGITCETRFCLVYIKEARQYFTYDGEGLNLRT